MKTIKIKLTEKEAKEVVRALSNQQSREAGELLDIKDFYNKTQRSDEPDCREVIKDYEEMANLSQSVYDSVSRKIYAKLY